MPSRREILAAFLGLPFALAACRTPEAPPLPEGELVGASDRLGHMLRDGLRPEPAAEAWERAGVVIVGGGAAGLAAAWRFLKAGFEDFVLLELEEAPGGTARSGDEHGVVPYPWGAHYLPAPTRENRALVSLLEEMGVVEGADEEGEPVVAEQFLCRDPEERVFYRGRWYEGLYLHAGQSEEDARQLQVFNKEVDAWAGWRDARGRRAFNIPVSTCSDDAEVTALDRLTMAEWMDARGLTSPRLRWLVDYACRDDYGLRTEQTSAWAGLFYFASRMKRPGAEAQSLITWPEGNGRLVRHLYEKARPRVRLGLAVADVRPAEGEGVEVVAVSRDGRQAKGFRASHVVFAAPQFLAKHLIRPYREQPPAHAAEFEYGAWMVANLFLKDRPALSYGSFPLAWDNVLYESPSLGYVVATHQRGLDRGPTVFTYYYPLTDADPRAARTRLLSAGRDDWAEVALSDLARAHRDIRHLTARLDVMRWGHAMIRPRPDFIWGGARRKAQTPHRRIHFANTDLSGIPLFEEAFDHGLRAAEEILALRGTGSEKLR
ncbi:MAG TPA: FAD-dependent oxidoreductase [Pyrinomonadaceae bacterium]|jgi:glycine/D-amino acid oxidase-like deaminating enzyme|nr:FAD-dependent oxidoreductase [Pyrinomonadaceae bacterium]